MTQAFNLSQFANFLNTSGQLSLSGSGITGTLAIANGGTNNASLAVTAGGVLYTDGSKVVNVGAGTAGQALLSQGAGAPIWGSAGATGTLLNIRYFTTAGSSTYTPTSGTTFVVVEIIGGGGGGFNGGNSYNGSGGGGGYARKKITSGFSGVTVTIGSGGSAGNPAGAGGTSSFGALVSATGGGAGSGAANVVTNITGAGGSGSSGDFNASGSRGGVSIAGTGYGIISVAGGNSPLYGKLGQPIQANGSVEAGAFGGGGFCNGNGNASSGGSGLCIVYEYA